jgi:hypothetical protein
VGAGRKREGAGVGGSFHWLALITWREYEAAEDMDRRAWGGRKKVLGFEHPELSRGASRSGKV